MDRDKILYSSIFGFISGVLIRSLWTVGNPFFYFVLFLSFIVLVCYFVISKKAKIVLLVSLFLFSGALGVFRFQLSADNAGDLTLNRLINQKVSLTGIIDDEPSIRENNTALTISLEKADVDGTEVKVGEKLLATVSSSEKYAYGDTIRLKGLLALPENFATDQGKTFDYVHYLRKDGIFYVMKSPEVEIVSHNGGSSIKRVLFSAKEKFLEKMNVAIKKPESTLMGGLILGEKSSFSSVLRQSFVNTGTIHIVALSGYNVTIVAEWIMKLLSFLPRNISFGGGIITIILFVIMTGGASTAIRASVMAILALFARASGRNYDAGRALLLAGVAMVLINPFILVFDVSFQLSFLATIAVIYLAPRVEKYFMWIKWKWLRDIVAITSAAYIFVMPFILYEMGSFSRVALPANFAVLPFIPVTMILGFITGFAGLISHFLSLLPGMLAYYLLHYELGAVAFFSNLPYSSISISNFPLFLAVLTYAVFLYALFGKKNAEIKREEKIHVPRPPMMRSFRSPFIIASVLLVIIPSAFLYYGHHLSDVKSARQLKALLVDVPPQPFIQDLKTKSADCHANGSLPDRACSPGAIFPNATVAQICVSGYTKTVRNVPLSLRKKVFAEYGISLPVPFGSYENDHIIALELGGSNDIANLYPESAKPAPGFHEKDVVENYLHQEVCEGRVALSVAQKQIATDWTLVYNNLSREEITTLKNKFRSWAGN
jgi:competence protein ComEC